MGCPIRESPDQRLFAAPRSLSQLTTPFIDCWRNGFPRAPLVLEQKPEVQPPAQTDGPVPGHALRCVVVENYRLQDIQLSKSTNALPGLGGGVSDRVADA